jgi:hypothetical protein
VATESKLNPDSPGRAARGSSRRVRKTDGGAIARDVAAESAAIYPDTFDTPPSPEEIATEAYHIYCERGYEDGRDLDHWLEAERRLSERRMNRQRGA